MLLGAPAGRAAQDGNQQILLSWTTPDDGGATITGYKCWDSVLNQWLSTGGTESSYTVPNLTALAPGVGAAPRQSRESDGCVRGEAVRRSIGEVDTLSLRRREAAAPHLARHDRGVGDDAVDPPHVGLERLPRKGQEIVVEAHERSFRFFGGVCRRGIYDSTKTAVNTVFTGKKQDYNRRFLLISSRGRRRSARESIDIV